MGLTQTNAGFTDAGVAVPLFEVVPKQVPNVLTAEITVDCRLQVVQVDNPSNSGQNASITVQDGAGNQLGFAMLTPGASYDIEPPKPGTFCSKGIKWIASASGVLIGSIQARLP